MNTIVAGAQWGDEGKGKIVDLLTEKYDVVARFQGGPNAGHTIVINDDTIILHHIPSGILREDKINIIGNGVIIDFVTLYEEIKLLEQKGINVNERLFISDRAHLILPYHLELDKRREQNQNIGTTLRGIGPTYSDKSSRIGIRVCDLEDRESLNHKLKQAVNGKGLEHVKLEKVIDMTLEIYSRMRCMVTDTSVLLDGCFNEGKNVLFEGAQGAMLDLDHGTYPYVTSSNTLAGSACAGLGFGPKKIDSIIGVLKAYCTRVGGGPFVSEIHDAWANDLREIGAEYGSTTGRPRRVGWLDLVAARYAHRINGFTSFAVTKIDVLDGFDTIKVCVGYDYEGKNVNEFPASLEVLKNCKPIYVELPGWKQNISSLRDYNKLPEPLRAYIDFIEQKLDVPVGIISVGSRRDQTIFKN